MQLEAAGAGRDPLFPRQSPPEPQIMPQRESGSDEEEDDHDDVEGGSAPTCRICLESNCEPGDELISPCMCKGTQEFVHRQCLDHWRSVKEGLAFYHCTTCMSQFHLKVEALSEEENNSSWRKSKFQLFIIRDVVLVFVAVQTMIAVMGGIVYLIVNNGAFKNSFDDNWDHIPSKHPIPFFYCVGVLGVFIIVGFVGLVVDISSLCSDNRETAGPHLCCYGGGDCCPDSIEGGCVLLGIFLVVFAILGIPYGFMAATMTLQKIWQRHYHILAKKELTKVYIVEDLHGCYSPPKLDPELEERLKMMLKIPT